MKPKRPQKPRKPPPPAPRPVESPPRGVANSQWRRHAVVLAALLAVCLTLYSGAAKLGFLMVDDPDYVLNNPYIESFNTAHLRHIFTTPYAANYAPANLLSYALDIAIGGKNARAFHISSVLWHAFVTLAVYALAFAISRAIPTAAAAALLFVIHPAHVEVVAWISSRKDLVAAGFAALAMAAYICYLRNPFPRGRAWYAASLLLFAAGSAGKQSVILLPVVMLAWDVFVEKRRGWRMLADKLPFGLVTLFFGWMTWRAQPPTNQALSFLTMAYAQLMNLWLLTGCGTYSLYRTPPNAAEWSLPARAALLFAAIAVWAAPFLLWRARQPVRAFLCCWILVQMIPPLLLSFIVPVTDRYLFLPSIGVCILVADAAAGVASRWRNAAWPAWGLAAALAVVWCAKTWNYLGEWGDPRSVWYGAHFKTKNPEVAQFLGEVYQEEGERMNNFVTSGALPDRDGAQRFARVALSDPAQVSRLEAEWRTSDASRTNTTAYRDYLWNFAWEQYRDALANRGKLSTPNLFMDRGRLLVSQGRYADAVNEFQTALAFAQTSSYALIRQETVTHALRSIAVAYWNMHRYRESEQWYLKAIDVQNKSGQKWVPTLEQELEQVRTLAAANHQ